MPIDRAEKRGFLTLLASRGAAYGLSLAVGLLLVRLLQPAVFGAYSLATTTVGALGILADLGLDAPLTRRASAGVESAPGLLGHALRLRVGLGLALLAPIWLTWLTGLALPVLGRPDLLLVGALSLLPRGVLRACAALLTGLGQIDQAARAEGIAALAASALTLPLIGLFPALRLGDGASGALWALVIGNTLGMIAVWRMGNPHPLSPLLPSFGRRGGRKAIPPHSAPPHLLREGLPFLLSGLGGALFQALDLYIVGHFYGGPDAVALYAAPFRILNFLLIVPTVWGAVNLPRYARMTDAAARRADLRGDQRVLLGLGAALAVICTLLAEPLTHIGLGPEYAQSAPALAILGWMTLPVCLSAPYIALLTAANRGGRIARSVLFGGIAALLANLIWAIGAPDRGLAASLSGVAAIKVGAMCGLLQMYWLARPRNLLESERNPRTNDTLPEMPPS